MLGFAFKYMAAFWTSYAQLSAAARQTEGLLAVGAVNVFVRFAVLKARPFFLDRAGKVTPPDDKAFVFQLALRHVFGQHPKQT